jgi:glutathione reductase (NADPH)
MPNNYDVLVIGTGVAASTIIERCHTAGKSVAVIDQRRYGGTCALRGCTPKKVLVHAASVVDAVRRLMNKGLREQTLIDWTELMAFKRSFTAAVPEKKEQSLRADGIATYHGQARFIEPRMLQVGDEQLQGERIVIASGAEPLELPIDGAEYLSSSSDFLELERLPSRIVFIGGGYIAFEFAHLAARAGAQVTILQRGEQLLKNFDTTLVKALVNYSRALGIAIHANHEVRAVTPENGGLLVHTLGGDGEENFAADLVVHSAGRAPALAALDLKRAGIECDGNHIKLNNYLQSVSNSAVYAAGDAAEQGPPLTPVATIDAQTVASNILKGNCVKPDYSAVPSVVFAIPPLARVGLSESEAREQGFKFRVNARDTSDWFTARHTGESCSAFKTLIEKDSGRLLGAHLLGPRADEVINLFAIAMRSGLTATELREAVLVFPTASHDIRSML